jgi:hypothetical protein
MANNSVQDLASLPKKKVASNSWMLLDVKGEPMLLEVDKYAIMHRVGIHARDLRILDPLLSYPSAILGRERAIVLNLEVRLVFSSIPTLIGAAIKFIKNGTGIICSAAQVPRSCLIYLDLISIKSDDSQHVNDGGDYLIR